MNLLLSDRELLDNAQSIIPCFFWQFITTEAFGAVTVGDRGRPNGFVLMTETDFWLDQKSGKLTALGEPELTSEQRCILSQAIELVGENRLHSVELVMQDLFK
mgnify:CR=1 FL=1